MSPGLRLELTLGAIISLLPAESVAQSLPASARWVHDAGRLFFGFDGQWTSPDLFSGSVSWSYTESDLMYVDPAGILYRRDGSGVLRYSYGTQYVGNINSYSAAVIHLDRLNNQVWYGLRPVFGTRDGRLLCQRHITHEWGYIDPTVSTAAFTFAVDGVFPTVITACNGRDIYGVQGTDILRGDLTRPGWSEVIGQVGPLVVSVRLGRDGRLLWLGPIGLHAFDPETGATQFLAAEPVQSQNTTYYFAHDPWSNHIAASDRNQIWGGCYAMYSNLEPFVQWRSGYGVPMACENHGLIVATPEPYEAFGLGCSNSAGEELRMQVRGVGRIGGTFELRTKAADPGALVAIWLGASETQHAGAPLPLALDSLGASGCKLLCSIDDVEYGQADANGVMAWRLAVPNDPALNGWDVYAQFASTIGVGGASFAASDAVMVRLRQL